MSETSTIQLRTSCILNVPLQTYCDDFTMIVNGEEFKIIVSRLMSDLLSPKICKIHINDPTFNQITINTQQKGDFSQFLRLFNFDEINIATDEIEFITEIIESLAPIPLKSQKQANQQKSHSITSFCFSRNTSGFPTFSVNNFLMRLNLYQFISMKFVQNNLRI